jgi:hypothetical protein
VSTKANFDQQPGYPGIQSAYFFAVHLLQRDCLIEARKLGFWTDGLPLCTSLQQSDPPCVAGQPLGIKDLPDVIGSCPLEPVAPSTDTDPVRQVADAVVKYLTTTGQWGTATVDLVYRVGTSDAGFGTTFAYQIPRWCGQAVADASYGVELTDTTGRWHGTDTHVGVVVAHFPTGWQVWGAFH